MNITQIFIKGKAAIIVLMVMLVQTLSAQQFSARIVGGITSSQISGDGAYGFVQFGAMGGAEVDYLLKENWRLIFGLRFNQKGSRVYKSKNSVDTYRLRVNYIEAPLMVNYGFDELSIGGGPVLGVKINQRERTQFGDVDDPRIFDPLELGFEFHLDYEVKEKWNVRLLFQNSVLAVRNHPIDQAFPPALFVLGTFHQKMLNQGQYFTSLSLILTYQL